MLLSTADLVDEHGVTFIVRATLVSDKDGIVVIDVRQ
jgi:hypothetical protein